ncbi:uncharacterized protein LOC111031913 [Myzus persicae]|uniref:uncharacterized protein LOC111031913 n=1 Tax=Myzus persicae TaxID=13164 RepID=UPI000B9387F1|nr:uncharacterized protein LOC111031913 [Myzus persicae]
MRTCVCSPYGEFGTQRTRSPLPMLTVRLCLYIKQSDCGRDSAERWTTFLRLAPIVISARQRHSSSTFQFLEHGRDHHSTRRLVIGRQSTLKRRLSHPVVQPRAS